MNWDHIGTAYVFAKNLIGHTPKNHLKSILQPKITLKYIVLYNYYRSPSKYQVKEAYRVVVFL